jgi:23S rRNA (uracil1939-C5)-methyltransferase
MSELLQCEHATRCGGCPLIALPEAEQHAHKRAGVRAAFARYPGLDAPEPKAIVAAQPSAAYRTRAKLVVARDGAVGLYARGSHDVVDIPGCRVLAPAVAAVVAEIRSRARTAAGALSGIDVREVEHADSAAVLVTLFGQARNRVQLHALAQEIAALAGVRGVAISEQEPRSPAFLGAAPEHVAGAREAEDTLLPGGAYHLATFGSFVQAHRAQAAAIGTRVIEALRGTLGGELRGARVLELYAGAGALGLELARLGARPFLVERFEPALALAQRAAAAQQLTIETRSADAAHAARDLAYAGERFDAAVVNPPRRGLPPELRSVLAELAPRAIAYVSCDPDTLARDLDHFAYLGYAARAIEPYDMMPHSDAVECLAWLEPAPPAACRVLYEDDELIAVDKPPHIATTPQGGQTRSLLERVRSRHGLPDLAAVHRLDAGTSGVCLFAKHRSAVAPFSAALAAGQKQYLALVRGVSRDKGNINRPLREAGKSRDARTRYNRVAVLGGHSLIRARPEQGRMHQIRRHLASLGHPVLGDTRYGDAASNRHFEMRHGLDRTFLHLTRIELTHPRSGEPLVIESALPGDLAAVRERLRSEG